MILGASGSLRATESYYSKPGWWISLAYALRRAESVEKAETILLRAQAIHPKVAMIAFNLACYASVAGRMEEAKERLFHAINLDKGIRGLALDDEDLKPLWDWIAAGKARLKTAFTRSKTRRPWHHWDTALKAEQTRWLDADIALHEPRLSYMG